MGSNLNLNIFFFFVKNFVLLSKKKIFALIFCSKNNRKYLTIAVNSMEDGENRISFIKDVEITGEKADTIYSALRNEIEKCSRVGFGSPTVPNKASVIIGHTKVASKLKRDNPKLISIHCLL